MKNKRRREQGLNTNLAAEFYVASLLFRRGYLVTVTFGNSKAIDLIVIDRRGRQATIDVKGLKNKTNWPVKEVPHKASNHVYVFVSFADHIADLGFCPHCFVVPSARLRRLRTAWSGSKGRRYGVEYRRLQRLGYRDNWKKLGKAMKWIGT